MHEEEKRSRPWKVCAPSGIAAANVGGVTLHSLFQMNALYESRVEADTDESDAFMELSGLIIDEHTMVDTDFWMAMKHLMQLFLLSSHLRKPTAVQAFGYRDIILIGDLCQLPPASGRPPLVTCFGFLHMFDFFVLKENRRQEKYVKHGCVFNKIRRGGVTSWPARLKHGYVYERCSIDADVQKYVVDAYVRGWGLSGSTVDIEHGVAMTSLRKDKDAWNNSVVKKIENDFPHCEKVDVTCAYNSGLHKQDYDPVNEEHVKQRQHYPKILKLRTCHEHRCRLVCLKNVDLRYKGLANGTMLRCLAANSWKGRGVRHRCGQQRSPNSCIIDIIFVAHDEHFVVYATKIDESTVSKRTRMPEDGHEFGIAEESAIVYNPIGSACAILLDLAYAVTIHKGQGLTIPRVYALLEHLFAHGQLYVQNSRTPKEEDFFCVGVPPEDILPLVLHQLNEFHAQIQRDLQILRASSAEDSPADLCTSCPYGLHVLESASKETLDAKQYARENLEEALQHESRRLDIRKGLEIAAGVTNRFEIVIDEKQWQPFLLCTNENVQIKPKSNKSDAWCSAREWNYESVQ